MKPFTLIWFIWQYTAQRWNGISGAHSPYLLYRSGPRSHRLAKGRQPFHYKSLAAAVPQLSSLLLQTMAGLTQADSLGQDGPNSVVVFMVSTAESLGTLQVLPHWWSLFTLSKEGKQPLFTSFFPPLAFPKRTFRCSPLLTVGYCGKQMPAWFLRPNYHHWVFMER